MTRIVSWNINGRQNLWQAAANLKSELNVDALLLQEAPRPPADLDVSVDLETPWNTVGSENTGELPLPLFLKIFNLSQRY